MPKGGTPMKIKTLINVGIIGKLENQYADKQGNLQTSCSVNFEQDNGLVTGNLKVTKEIYPLLERGKNYLLEAEYNETKYGNYIKVIGINDSNLGK